MTSLKVAVFYEVNIYQQIIFRYLKEELKHYNVILTAITTVEEMLAQIAQNEIDILMTGSNYLFSHKDWSGQVNKQFSRLCDEYHVRCVLFTSGSNVWLLRLMNDMKFDALINTSDDLSVLRRDIISIILNDCALPFISESIKTILRTTQKESQVLSAKEWEVIYLLAQGYSISEIAVRKSRALSTVANQKHNAMKKLNITKNFELIKFIQIAGIME